MLNTNKTCLYFIGILLCATSLFNVVRADGLPSGVSTITLRDSQSKYSSTAVNGYRLIMGLYKFTPKSNAQACFRQCAHETQPIFAPNNCASWTYNKATKLCYLSSASALSGDYDYTFDILLDYEKNPNYASGVLKSGA